MKYKHIDEVPDGLNIAMKLPPFRCQRSTFPVVFRFSYAIAAMKVYPLFKRLANVKPLAIEAYDCHRGQRKVEFYFSSEPELKEYEALMKIP